MRICLISREYPPDTGFGGIATFARNLAQGLVELGHEVEVVALCKNQTGEFEDGKVKVHRVDLYGFPDDLRIANISMPYSRYVIRSATALWEKFLQLHKQRPFDVVDTPELLAEGFYPGITRAVPLAIRLYTPHSKFMAEQLHNVSPSFDHRFVAMVERVAMLSADVLTSPSNDLARFVAQDLNIPAEKIRIVRNPINPSDFMPEGTRAFEAPEGRKTVLFVGRLEERKGIYYLVNAIPTILERHPQTHFVIIGDDTNNAVNGQRSVLADLKATLDSAGVSANVTFINRIPLAELPAYYRSADICVVPSLYDNSPYTSMEGMSCGKPVVGTSGGGTPEYVINGKTGLIVPPKDSAALADAISTLLADDKLRLTLGAQARQHIVENFDRIKIAAQTVELYNEARQKHSLQRPAMYRKRAEQALPDAAFMLVSFDKMLYDLVYMHSWRFRIEHWWRLAKSRPRLLAAKALLGISQLITSLPGLKTNRPEFVTWLENEVSTREEEPINRILSAAPLSETQSGSLKQHAGMTNGVR